MSEKKENAGEKLKKAGKVIVKTITAPLKHFAIIAVIVALIIVSLCASYDALLEQFSDWMSSHMTSNPLYNDNIDPDDISEIRINEKQLKEVDALLAQMGTSKEKLDLSEDDLRKILGAELSSQSIMKEETGNEEVDKIWGRVKVYIVDGSQSVENVDEEEYYQSVIGAYPMQFLKYEGDDGFADLENKKDESITQFFSVHDGKLCIANTVVTTGNDGEETSPQIEVQEIDLKTKLQPYVTPVEFLLDLAILTNNSNFVMELTNRILQDTEIRLLILKDEYSETRDRHIDYTLNEEIAVKTENYDEEGKNVVSETESIIPEEPETGHEEKTRTVTTTKLRAEVLYADTWFVHQENTFNMIEPEPEVVEIPADDPSNKLEPETKPAHSNYEYQSSVWQDANPEILKSKTYMSTVSWRTNQTQSVTNTTTVKRYQKGASTSEDTKVKTDEILELLKTPFKKRNSDATETMIEKLDTGSGLLFRMLQKNERTQTLEQILRYVLHTYNGKDYGLDYLDLSIFNTSDFTNLSRAGSNFLKELIFSWEGTPVLSDDKTKYKVFNDGAGVASVGHGLTILWCYDDLVNNGYVGYTKEEILEKYEEEDIYIDKAIVEAVEDEIIAEKLALVEGLGLELTTYQKYALVLRAYNYNLDGFKEAYEEYWDPAVDNEKYFEKNVSYTHSLYTEYMSTPITSNGIKMDSLVARRKAEWALFSAGYDMKTGKYFSESGSEIAEYALQFVGEGHSRFTSYFNTESNWCAMFVSYCFDKLGLIPSVLQERYSGCSTEYRILLSRGEWEYSDAYSEYNEDGGTYTPQAGDIIFFTDNPTAANPSCHTGIVVDCDGSNVYTVEGNTGESTSDPYWRNSSVNTYTYSINSSYIFGYFPASQK